MRIPPGLRGAVLRHAPSSALRLVRRLQRSRRRLRYRMRTRAETEAVSRADVVAALREAGLGPGDGVFFQAAMSPFGQIEGGPETVIGALDEVVGEDALVAMPAFAFRGSVLEHVREDPRFDVRSTPSAMGAVSERFRQRPGTERSLHPTHSVAARGPGAAALVEGHERAATPFGSGTPFERMVERGMHQVWFGTDVHAFTLYHTFECLEGRRFPIDVFAPEPVPMACVDASGSELTVETLIHDPEVAQRRIRSNARQEVRRRMLAEGVMRAVPLGRSEVLVCSIPAMFELLDRLLDEGLTIYDIEVEGPRDA